MTDEDLDARMQKAGLEWLECVALINAVLRPNIAAESILAALAQGGYVTIKTVEYDAMERRIEKREQMRGA